MEEFNWDDGFYSECDMYREECECSNWARFLLSLAIILTIIFILIVIVASFIPLHTERERDIEGEELQTVYDSQGDSVKILDEGWGRCAECGLEGYTINGNIVCRNENCPNYGLETKAIMEAE